MARYISPVASVQDVNGKPIVGAKLFFFETGTTTPKAIYEDSGLTTPLNNPVLADANGQYTDNIFLDGIYKNVQQDNSGTATGFDGATIWTKDPIGDIVEGQFELWLNDNTYNIPEIVLGSDDSYYQSIVDGNQGNDPTTSPTKWKEVPLPQLSAAVSGTDTYTATLNIASYKAGETYPLSFTNTNTIAAPTLNFDGLGAKTIKNSDGSALAIGAIPDEAICRYDGTDMILLNPVILFASSAEVITGTNAEKIVSPLTQGDHRTACKAWVNFNGAGTIVIRDSYNVDSITDHGAGAYTVNFTNDMRDINYSVVGCGMATVGTRGCVVSPLSGGTYSVSAVRITAKDTSDGTIDPSRVLIHVFGD